MAHLKKIYLRPCLQAKATEVEEVFLEGHSKPVASVEMKVVEVMEIAALQRALATLR